MTKLANSKAHMLRKETMKCICGNQAQLKYRDMLIRMSGKIVIVKNAPGYIGGH